MSEKNQKSSQDNEPKTFLGMPMQWDYKNWHKDIWNPENDEIFPPKRFGIGWGLNFHAALKKIGLIRKQK